MEFPTIDRYRLTPLDSIAFHLLYMLPEKEGETNLQRVERIYDMADSILRTRYKYPITAEQEASTAPWLKDLDKP